MKLETYSARGNQICKDYEKAFENHIAKVTEFEGHQVITWRRHDTVNYSMKIICSGNNIFISGDLGEAVYWCTWKTSWQNIANSSFGYLLGKLQCVTHGKESYDSDECTQELDSWYEEFISDNEEDDFPEGYFDKMKEFVEEAKRYNSDEFEWISWLRDSDMDEFEDPCDSPLWTFGQQINNRLYGYWVAFHMIKEQLECI